MYLYSTLLYTCAALSLSGALTVLLSHESLKAALGLALGSLGLAGLFLLSGAWFLAALQIMVYVGAVVVLFLFILMLVGTDEQKQKQSRLKFPICAMGSGFLLVAFMQVYRLVLARPMELLLINGRPIPQRESAWPPSTQLFSEGLFGRYGLVVECVGVLLLIAIIGVVLIGKSSHEDAP